MKSCTLTIRIDKPVADVFAFTTNPKNTPRWVASISHEETNEWPVKVGSIYRNQNKNGEWSEFFVSAYIKNKVFELSDKNSDYHVRYTYATVENAATELTYFEWVDSGELDNPFTPAILEKLKALVENT